MKKQRLTYVLIVAITLLAEVKGHNHYFRQYANAEGFPNSFVYDMNQDDKGFLWIGTPEGLFKFNGFDFKQFTVQDSLANDFVTKIYKDSEGRIWIGHQNGAISLQVDESFTKLHMQTEAPGMVSDFAEDDKGFIWFSTQNQGLGLIDKDLNIKSVSFPIPFETLTQIEAINDDLFLIGTHENLYFTKYNRDKSSMSILAHYDSYPDSKVVDLFPDTQGGYIVISQEEGFYSLLPDTIPGTYILKPIDENLDGALDNIQGGLVDCKGKLWLNTMGNGLILYRSTPSNQFLRTERISTENGLISDDIRTIFEDQEGNIWCGSFGDGLLKYVNNNLTVYDFSLEGQEKGSYAISGDSAKLLVVSGNRLLFVDPLTDTLIFSYPLPERGFGDRVTSVFLAEDGIIWLGYEQSGLYTLDNPHKQLKSVYISSDELTNSINHITGKGEDIWVSTKKGIFRINRKNGATKWFTTNDGLPHNNIKQIYIDYKGRVLIATLCREVFFINENQQVEVLKNSSMGQQNSLVSFEEGHIGKLWVATQGNGLWSISEDTIKNYTKFSGLYSDFCYSLAISKQGHPIVGHTGGISHINLESNIIKTYSQLDGVNGSSEFYSNAIHKDQWGNVWLGTSESLIKYSTEISKGGKIAPRISIDKVSVNGQNVDPSSGPIHLKPGQYELSIDFIGLSFTNPELVFYQTRLDRYSRDWSGPSFDRTIKYDRVDHGHYTFEIRAYNENEICSELSPAVEFIIQKPIYLSFWFYAIISLLLGIGFYLILQMRERNHQVVQERLLRNLDEKSKEIIVKEEIIKERKKIEKVLIEAKTKAEQSDKLKTSFLQNMSHEIRTPMNAIVGFSELLKLEGLTEQDRDEYLAAITKNTASLLHLIEDIMDVSKLETQQLILEEEPCRLNPMMKDLHSMYLEKILDDGKDGIELNVICPPNEDFEINTDPTRLKQILMKLLDNAVKFTESGEIRFGFSLETKQILFFVEDTGIGLIENKKEVIFDLFRKIEEDKLKLYGGTGLGLTLARYLVNLMGGDIDVESHKDIGTKFIFTLPYKKDPEMTSLTTEYEQDSEFSTKFNGKRILIVEDTDSNFLLIQQLLSSKGAVTERAIDGETALKKVLVGEAIDLIIMDIKLPGENGYEITRKIRARDVQIPIISHTAYGLEGDREKSLEAGCTDYIPKPTERNKFLSIISKYL